MSEIIFEACVDSIESAITAGNAGVDRIELCAGLEVGGLTPSYGLILIAIEQLTLPVNVLIRPRCGDFIYSGKEFEVMKRDILFCRDSSVNGVVIGLLKSDGTIDKERIFELIKIARPMSITFNRAFDFTRDPLEALDTLIELEVDRVLTSGQEQSACEGIDTIKRLVDRAKDRIIVMPGGGINENNVKKIITKSGVKEIHASARESVKSKMNYHNTNLSMISPGLSSENEIKFASEERIRKIIKSISQGGPVK